jgi:hypothetical protein
MNATHRIEALPASVSEATRSLLVIWQNPATRKFQKIGRLSHLVDGSYSFSYLDDDHRDPDFFPLDEYPEFDRVYVSTGLPAFFANRVMSADRPSYGTHLSWLGLEPGDDDIPMEVLARTGGGRATDTFHVVDVPVSSRQSGLSSRFFVSGVRHQPGAAPLVGSLSVGDELAVRSDHTNPANEHALLIDAKDGKAIGWVPDWLVDDVRAIYEHGERVRVSVARVNPEAPPHLHVMCLIESL